MQVHEHIPLPEPFRHQLTQLPFLLLPEHLFQLFVSSLEAAAEHQAEHVSDASVLVAVAGHVFTLTDGVSDLQICLHHLRVVLFVLIFLVEDAPIVDSEQIDPTDLFVELVHIKPEDPLEDNRGVFLLRQPGMLDKGDQHDDHGDGVEPAFVGEVETVDGEKFLHDDDDRVEGFYAADPLPDGCCGANAQMRGYVVVRGGLDSDVCLDGPAVVRPVQLVELPADERDRCVDCQLQHGDGCSLDEFALLDAGMRHEHFLNSLQSHSDPLRFGDHFDPLQDRLVDGDVDVAVLDGYSVGAAAE